MKRIFIILTLIFFCFQFSFSQQVIHTNKRSTCSYNGTSLLQNCVDENVNTVFTFNEDAKTFTHHINEVDVIYAIESRVYNNPDWTYRISNSEGLMYDLILNQVTKIIDFYPVRLVAGAIVYRYQYN